MNLRALLRRMVQIRSIDKSALSLSLYMGTSYFLLLTVHWIGVNFSKEIWGITSPYTLEWQQYYAWLCYLLLYCLLFYKLMARDFRNLRKRGIKVERTTISGSLGFKAMVIVLMGSIPLFVLIEGILFPQNLLWIFVLSVIIGIWVFYKVENIIIVPQILKEWSSEALKLLHDAELRLLTQVSSMVMIGFTAGILAVWLNILWPSIPAELRMTTPALLLQTIITLQIIILTVGLWKGYFEPILIRLHYIRETISKSAR